MPRAGWFLIACAASLTAVLLLPRGGDLPQSPAAPSEASPSTDQSHRIPSTAADPRAAGEPDRFAGADARRASGNTLSPASGAAPSRVLASDPVPDPPNAEAAQPALEGGADPIPSSRAALRSGAQGGIPLAGAGASAAPASSTQPSSPSPDDAGPEANQDWMAEIEVPVGAKVPAAVLDESSARPLPQQRAIRAILEQFRESVSTVDLSTPAGQRAWEHARLLADERYRILFGDAAFDALTRRAALEALAERKASN